MTRVDCYVSPDVGDEERQQHYTVWLPPAVSGEVLPTLRRLALALLAGSYRSVDLHAESGEQGYARLPYIDAGAYVQEVAYEVDRVVHVGSHGVATLAEDVSTEVADALLSVLATAE